MLVDINNPGVVATYAHAIRNPIPSPGSLWMPVRLERFNNIEKYSKFDIACKVAVSFLRDELRKKDIHKIVDSAFTFDAPVVPLLPDENMFVCELFHGPTQAFKDFGARFSAHVTKKLCGDGTVAAATSGDTGGAVVSACEDCGLNSLIFYPSGRISGYQLNQIVSTEHKLSIPIAVEGDFDSCQKAIKECLEGRPGLYSGNSVNVLRLIAQIIYYFWIGTEYPVGYSVSVPSGNLGNVVAALMAKEMGAPIFSVIIAGNSNISLDGGMSKSLCTPTLATAMDVKVPSNLPRLNYLHPNWKNLDWIHAASIQDWEITETLHHTFDKGHYLVDPHTAVGIAAARAIEYGPEPMVVLSTASPIKFRGTLERILGPVYGPTQETVGLGSDLSMRESAPWKLSSACPIVLTGMPGAGKTTLGNLLAARLGHECFDIDSIIEQEHETTLAEIIRVRGNKGFTRIEKETCLKTISDRSSKIISPGGSASLIPEVAEALRAHCLVVWLDVDIDTILMRMGNPVARGVVMKPGQSFSDLFAERTEKYKNNYDIRLSNSNFQLLLSFLKLWY